MSKDIHLIVLQAYSSILAFFFSQLMSAYGTPMSRKLQKSTWSRLFCQVGSSCFSSRWSTSSHLRVSWGQIGKPKSVPGPLITSKKKFGYSAREHNGNFYYIVYFSRKKYYICMVCYIYTYTDVLTRVIYSACISCLLHNNNNHSQ